MPGIHFEDSTVTITDVRDFRSVDRDSATVGYYDRTYDLNRLESVWLCISVFNEAERRGPAHSMLSFGFDDGVHVVISVEARKEVGEGYSIYQGLFKKYEIIYVIGDERDLVLTRAVFRDDDVYLYPIRTTQQKARELFVNMLHTAASLRERPQFYNTLTNNCTTKLRDHVNAIAPGRIPYSWKILLPGYADELLQSLGLIDPGIAIEDVRRRYWINDLARRHAESPAFSTLIRQPDR